MRNITIKQMKNIIKTLKILKEKCNLTSCYEPCPFKSNTFCMINTMPEDWKLNENIIIDNLKYIKD